MASSRRRSSSGFAPSGWHDVEPKTQAERRALAARCGKQAFLLEKEDGKLMFPIVPQDSTTCEPDVRGLVAARMRARMNGYTAVAARADAMLRDLQAAKGGARGARGGGGAKSKAAPKASPTTAAARSTPSPHAKASPKKTPILSAVARKASPKAGAGAAVSPRRTLPLTAMLAARYDARAHAIRFPAFAQPKLDGERCLFTVATGAMTARSGKPVNAAATTLRAELARVRSGADLVLDGELYMHGGASFQDVTRAIRRDAPQLQYWVYDVVMDAPFRERLGVLRRWYADNAAVLPHVVLVPTLEVRDTASLRALADGMMAEGYEGTIVRNADATYQPGKRTDDLQKMKAFQDAEFRVVGWKRSTVGTVIWRCAVRPGVEFDVKPMGTNAENAAALRSASRRVGALYTVKFFGWTESGKPRMPTGVGFRDVADLPADASAAAAPSATPRARRGSSSSSSKKPRGRSAAAARRAS